VNQRGDTLFFVGEYECVRIWKHRDAVLEISRLWRCIGGKRQTPVQKPDPFEIFRVAQRAVVHGQHRSNSGVPQML
jgi:hypothetical protein